VEILGGLGTDFFPRLYVRLKERREGGREGGTYLLS